MKMEEIEKLEEAARKYSGIDKIRLAFWEGSEWHRNNDYTLKKVEDLRDDIEETNSKLDLVRDSELIQCYGSIIGRLNLILNQ